MYDFLGSDLPAKEQRERLNFTHCGQPAQVKVDLEWGNVETRCKCGVKVKMQMNTLVGALEFLDRAGLPHDIGFFLRAQQATVRMTHAV